MTFLHNLPSVLFAILTIGVFVGVAVSGLVITRAWVRGRGFHALVDNGVIGWIFSAILVIYAIAIGLLSTEAWENAARASNEASDEAARIAALYRDLTGYPDPVQAQLRQMLTRYTHVVIEQEWPMQRRGEV